jgi:cell division protein FtsL
VATDGKKFFLDHFEKMAFGVAGLALLLFLVSMFSGSEAKVQAAKVTKLNSEIKEKKQEATDRLEELKRRQKAPAFQQVIQQELAGGLFPGEMPKWLFHRRPFIADKS